MNVLARGWLGGGRQRTLNEFDGERLLGFLSLAVCWLASSGSGTGWLRSVSGIKWAFYLFTYVF
jgi:hypothetical protein